MKLGIGLYRHMVTPSNLRFAKQIGCTHIVVHLVDYFRKPEAVTTPDNQPVDNAAGGWGVAGDPDALWTTAELVEIRRQVEAEGLTLEAIENFDPGPLV